MLPITNTRKRAFSAGSGNSVAYAMSSPSATTGGGLGGTSPVCFVIYFSALHVFRSVSVSVFQVITAYGARWQGEV